MVWYISKSNTGPASEVFWSDAQRCFCLRWCRLWGIITCDIGIEKMVFYFEGYLEAYDNGYRAYSDVCGLAYTWVEWLECNIRRALGECIDEAEKVMGVTEVNNSINRIKYIYNNEKEIKAALDFHLVKCQKLSVRFRQLRHYIEKNIF